MPEIDATLAGKLSLSCQILAARGHGNLTMGHVTARSPDQDYLVYVLAEGSFGEENYRYYRANLATGEQMVVAESGTTRLRPLRWLDDHGAQNQIDLINHLRKSMF